MFRLTDKEKFEAAIADIRVREGGHEQHEIEQGEMCVMEMISVMQHPDAWEKFDITYYPPCCSGEVTARMIHLNDSTNGQGRQKLKLVAFDVIHTAPTTKMKKKTKKTKKDDDWDPEGGRFQYREYEAIVRMESEPDYLAVETARRQAIQDKDRIDWFENKRTTLAMKIDFIRHLCAMGKFENGVLVSTTLPYLHVKAEATA